jgi:hypothetical protein
LRVHEVGANEKDEMLKRLLSTVKIVERVDKPKEDHPATEKPEESAAPPPKRPWWKFWG